MMLILWSSGCSVTWDVTVVNTLADSYISTSSQQTAGVAELAATRKEAKYADLAQRYTFIPIAVETLGVINTSGLNFISDIGCRITAISGDARETSFLLQRISVVIQRYKLFSMTVSSMHQTMTTARHYDNNNIYYIALNYCSDMLLQLDS